MSHTSEQTSALKAPLKGTVPKRRLLDEESFHDIISIERKRAERSKKAFLLMLLDLGRLQAGEQNGNGQGTAEILSALSASLRETDVTGWHTSHTVIGIIFTDLPLEARKSIAGTMLSRVSGILYNTLTFDDFNQITISHYVFPEDWDHDVAQRPSHPKLYPDLERRDTRSKLVFGDKDGPWTSSGAFADSYFSHHCFLQSLSRSSSTQRDQSYFGSSASDNSALHSSFLSSAQCTSTTTVKFTATT